MILMVIAMFLPVLALPVFWILPPVLAIPIYLFCLVYSGLMHWGMWSAMKQPAKTGIESLIGREATVLSASTAYGALHYLVRIEGEIWSATSNDSLEPGEDVVVLGIQDNKLAVKRKTPQQSRRQKGD